jgi:hypothetical protein
LTTLNDIVNVNIIKDTTAVARSNFNIPCFIDVLANFNERHKSYSSLDAVLGDFVSTDNAYKAAAAFFGQELKPPSITIGRKAATNTIYTATASTAIGDVYKFTIVNTAGVATEVIFTTVAGTSTPTVIATGLKASFDALAVDLKTGVTVTPTAVVTVTGSCKLHSSNLTMTNTAAAETWTSALSAVLSSNIQWYALTASTRTKAEQEELALAIEGMDRIYGTATTDATAYTAAITDIGYSLKDKNYENSFTMWSLDAATGFPECAFIGACLPATPGSNSWNFKQLTGVGKVNLDTSQITYLKGTEASPTSGKNYNIIEEIADVRYAGRGQMAGGEWIDNQILIHWTKARIRERVYFRMINSPKIPYTSKGLALIEAEIRAVLAEGVRNGGYAENPRFTVTVPDVSTIEPNLRAKRILEGVTFRATLAGAVNSVNVQGRVEV